MTTEQQKAFEVALAPDGYDFKKDADGIYIAVATRIAYRGWQAAIAHFKQHMQTPEMVERVAEVSYLQSFARGSGAAVCHRGWGELQKICKEEHRKRAKAAIAAITEDL